MTRYRVKFFNNLTNCNGQEFKCLQRSLTIREATDQDDAVEMAKREFERVECISNWRCHAHLVEAEPLPVIGAYRGVAPHRGKLR